MKRPGTSVTFLFVICITAVFLFPGCKKSVESKMRWKFEGREKKNYEFTRRATLYLTGEIEGSSLTPIEENFEFGEDGRLDFKANYDGTADLLITVEEYNPAREAAENSELLTAVASAIPIKMRRMGAKIGPDGNAVTNQAIQTGGHIAQGLLDEFLQLPPDPDAKPGDSWEKTIESNPFDDEPVDGTISTTFTGWDLENDIKLADFESDIQLKTELSKGRAKLFMEFTGKGNWTFCPYLGSLISSDIQYSITLNGHTTIADPRYPWESVKVIIKGNGDGFARLR